MNATQEIVDLLIGPPCRLKISGARNRSTKTTETESAYWKTAAQEGRAVFTKLEPNSAVELHWVDDGQSANAGLQSNHTLTYRIQAGRDCTVVTMSDQDSRAPDEETLALLEEGWNSVLLELKDYCERKERSAKRRHAVGSSLS